MKNSNDTIGNRTRDLSACSAVPQPTAPPRAPLVVNVEYVNVAVKHVLCANFCFENNVTPCLNKTTITSLPLQLTLLAIHRDVMFEYALNLVACKLHFHYCAF